jgi:Tfp pilus assembly protein PilF
MMRLSVRCRSFSAIAVLCALTLPPQSAFSFDPYEGAEPAARPSAAPSPRLPSTVPLLNTLPPIAFPEGTTPYVPAPAVAQPMPEPMPVNAALPQAMPEPVAAAIPNLPPVDPYVAQRAHQEMQAAGSYIAPAPNFAPESLALPPAPAPAPAMAPMADAPAPMDAMPTITGWSLEDPPLAPAMPALTDSSARILSALPKSKPHPSTKPGKLSVQRMSPDSQTLAAAPVKMDSYDSIGLSIAVARPGLDANYELNRAYTTLMGGQTSEALAIYKNVLTSDPKNQDALFGVASTYHRTGQIDKARPYYGELLRLNPDHREGLNNFLALISEEAPQEAMAELERLEQRNPGFSPIPARQAIILSRLGYGDAARERMLRAIEIDPNNMNYKYNLAVMLDREGYLADAVALYRLLIEASLRGEKLPASTDQLQKRMNFIAAKVNSHSNTTIDRAS